MLTSEFPADSAVPLASPSPSTTSSPATYSSSSLSSSSPSSSSSTPTTTEVTIPTTLLSLPIELLEQIFRRLPTKTLKNIILVSKRFGWIRISRALWKRRFANTFIPQRNALEFLRRYEHVVESIALNLLLDNGAEGLLKVMKKVLTMKLKELRLRFDFSGKPDNRVNLNFNSLPQTLTRLDLDFDEEKSGLVFLDGRVFVNMLKGLPNLESLHLNNHLMKSNYIITNIPCVVPKLKKLTVSVWLWSDLLTVGVFFQDFVRNCVKYGTKLEYLCLYGFELHNSGRFAQLARLEHLKYLIMNDCFVQDRDVLSTLSLLPNLEYVKFFNAPNISIGCMERLGFVGCQSRYEVYKPPVLWGTRKTLGMGWEKVRKIKRIG